MTQAEVFEAIRTRFQTLIATPEGLRVIHDNAPEPSRTMVSRWVRFSVQVDSHQQVAMGARRYRMVGSATALVFVPKQEGDAAALAIADDIITAFRGVSLTDPMVTFTPAPGIIGTAADSEAWCQRTVRIPFRADTVEA